MLVPMMMLMPMVSLRVGFEMLDNHRVGTASARIMADEMMYKKPVRRADRPIRRWTDRFAYRPTHGVRA